MKLSLQRRLVLTIIVTLSVWGHIAWDYFHGGIPTHYVLHDPNMPGIPNWLGGMVLPFFTWFLFYRIHQRIDGKVVPVASEGLRIVVLRFILAMLVALSISVFFTFEVGIIDYIILALFGLAFIFPLFKSEYLLGWVLGSTFTFGAIIPIAFGSMLALIFFILFQLRKKTFALFS